MPNVRLHKTQSLGPRTLPMRGLQVRKRRGVLSGGADDLMMYQAFCTKVPEGYALLITVHPFPSRDEASEWLDDVMHLIAEDEEQISGTIH